MSTPTLRQLHRALKNHKEFVAPPADVTGQEPAKGVGRRVKALAPNPPNPPLQPPHILPRAPSSIRYGFYAATLIGTKHAILSSIYAATALYMPTIDPRDLKIHGNLYINGLGIRRCLDS
ncbi:hypothetical protein CJF30_00010860 [Rutstroemia sp. NJR-2017a BBW]|nr:hypothetical protein CJF30_00010860 [Rutstroemia sp. NJR-2017a BBW]